MRTLYDVIKRSTASAPEASMFLAVVKYCVLELTPPSLLFSWSAGHTTP